MNNCKLARLAAVTAAAALTCAVASADSLNMAVTANVSGKCKMVSVPPLDFGTLDQVLAPVVTPAAVSVTYRCTKGTAPSTFTVGGFASSPFTGSLTTAGPDTIAYTIAWPTPVNTVGGGLGALIAPVTVLLTGSMPGGANYQNVAAGPYAQTVPVAITP